MDSDVNETVTGNVKLRFFLHSGKYFYLLSCVNRKKFQVIFKYKYRENSNGILKFKAQFCVSNKLSKQHFYA